MAVKIGHASISERGTVNGNKGDSTGKEVCIRNLYNKDWDYVLIPKSDTLADKSAEACEAGCANANIGYGQADRNTAHTEAKKVGYDLSKIKTKCNTDCSAFMTLCAIAGGATKLEYTGNAPTTSTMGDAFVKSGYYTKSTDKKYLTGGDYLKRGYILVHSGHHTVMVLSNGIKAGTEKKATPVKEGVEYYKAYTGKSNSLVDGLTAVGVKDTGKPHRTNIAKANGISNYTGSVAENNALLKKLKEGKLIKA